MLISKETTLQVFDNIPTINGLCLEPVIALRDVKEIIKAVPEVDAVPVVHGKWTVSEYEYLDCSECGNSYYTGCESTSEANYRLKQGFYFKYCPYCGAKMGVEEQNEG